MREITVNKTNLIDIIEKNRAQHIKEYKEAMAGYKLKVIEGLENALKKAKMTNPKFITSLSLVAPTSQEKDYDRALGMLKMHTEDNITLDAQEYQNYVQDEWNWTHMFKTANAMYTNR